MVRIWDWGGEEGGSVEARVWGWERKRGVEEWKRRRFGGKWRHCRRRKRGFWTVDSI